MNISIYLVPISQKHVISNLLELYAYDFSEISFSSDKFEVNKDGRFGYPALDKYWWEHGRFAYLFYVNNNIAGFALVHQNSVLQSAKLTFKIAEFFVLRKYRRKGVGTKVAKLVLHQHPGFWEIPVIKNNHQGFKFWLAVLSKIVKNNYQIIEANNAEWKGPVFSFAVDI